jgi:hypothetical protein
MRIVYGLEVTFMDCKAALTCKDSSLSTEYYAELIRKAMMLPIYRTALAEDDRLETDLRFACSDIEGTGLQETLRGPSVGTVSFVVQNRVSFSSVLVP